jgi:hypothetical protein
MREMLKSRIGRVAATMMSRGMLVLALSGALILGLGNMADAATGQWGGHSTPWSSCDTAVAPTVLVHAPMIKATWVTYPANVLVWPNHTQWVGYRAWLLRYNSTTKTWGYTDQNGDGYADHGPLFKAQVVNGNLWDPPSEWLNVDRNQWESGATFLPVRYAGYYRVRTEYFWYADQVAPSPGYDVADETTDYSVSTGVTVISVNWCQYGV